MVNNSFLLYGAYGYTGQLIAEMASSFGLRPILAGRDKERLKVVSDKTGFEMLTFSLTDREALDTAVSKVKLVLHAAGPFIETARPMVESCIRNKAHYIDINGDISCFQLIHNYDQQAKTAGVMLLPGVGFDVLPTDCLALFLKKQLPDAVLLKIAFANQGSRISHGTAMTVAGKLGEGGAERENGKIIKLPIGAKGLNIQFGSKEIFAMSIPWGDLYTAYFTTGIANIETYTAVPRKIYNLMKFQSLFNWLLRTEVVRYFIRKKINAAPAGPDKNMLATGRSLVWAQVKNEPGKTVEAYLEGPESYQLTVLGSLVVTRKILEGLYKPGYQTPAGCYGEDLVLEIEGVKRT